MEWFKSDLRHESVETEKFNYRVRELWKGEVAAVEIYEVEVDDEGTRSEIEGGGFYLEGEVPSYDVAKQMVEAFSKFFEPGAELERVVHGPTTAPEFVQAELERSATLDGIPKAIALLRLAAEHISAPRFKQVALEHAEKLSALVDETRHLLDHELACDGHRYPPIHFGEK